ncbi:MAG: hypothetical protein WAK24_02325 [Candidatus Acidiferrales bacterium]
MPPVSKKLWIAVALGSVLLALFLFKDYYARCHGKPLSRAEALERATEQLRYLSRDFALGNPAPTLVDEQYDASQKTWNFTFRNGTCEVSVIADRCKGTNIGGITAGCTKR